MPVKQLQHRKIRDFKAKSLPIEYSSLRVDARGKIDESALDQRIVKGYGVLWGSRNSHGEKFVKGAFSKSITENGPDSKSQYKIKFRDRHGKSCALMATLKEDEIGLYFETKPLDAVSWADDLLTQLRSGTLNNFSIGFKHVWDRVEWDDEDDSLVCLEAILFEISCVDIPSDMSTYAVRTGEKEYLSDDVEDFIELLPRSMRVEARILFTRCMSPTTEDAPPKQRKVKAPRQVAAPTEEGVDYSYIIKNFKIKNDD